MIDKITAGIFGFNGSIISKSKEQKNGRCNNNSSSGRNSLRHRAWYYYLATAAEGD
jgi:hypothetical protein